MLSSLLNIKRYTNTVTPQQFSPAKYTFLPTFTFASPFNTGIHFATVYVTRTAPNYHGLTKAFKIHQQNQNITIDCFILNTQTTYDTNIIIRQLAQVNHPLTVSLTFYNPATGKQTTQYHQFFNRPSITTLDGHNFIFPATLFEQLIHNDTIAVTLEVYDNSTPQYFPQRLEIASDPKA